MIPIRFACAVVALAIAAVVTPVGRAVAATNQVIEMPNGLKYTDTKTGDGAAATPGNKVSVHYTGWLYNNGAKGAKFDSSVDIGQPFQFTLGEYQVVAGVRSGSLALLADAGHNLGDVLGLALSWGAAVLGRRQPSGRFTYGLRSSSILAALANAIILLVVTGGIAWEAIWRISHPMPVASGIIVAVAAIGIFVNGGTALLFCAGAGDLNVKTAFFHL